MVFCHNCGRPHPEGARFCTGCGSRLQQADNFTKPTQPMGRAYASSSPLNQNPFPSGQEPTVCAGCHRLLPEEQVQQNVLSHKAMIRNLWTITIMLLLLLIGSVLVLISVAESGYSLSRQVTLPSFLIGVVLCAIPFVMLVVKRDRLLKKVEGASSYCPDCMVRMNNSQRRKMDESYRPRTVSSGQSKHYENELKDNRKWFVFWATVLMIPGLIFGWLYGTYVKGMDLQENVEAICFFIVIVAGIIVFVLSRSPTPLSVEITPNSVVVELKRRRSKVIPYDRITWLNVIMDVSKIKDLPNDTGTIYVGRNGILQMSYRIKREIALDVREAYRAYRGVYPPNGYDAKPNSQERR